jgi:colanic acid/amylovoran biosynthesis glycosyltransferase
MTALALLRPAATQTETQPATRRTLKIAYLTTEYPKVSHTFIRREIRELERRGHEVVRLSVRPPSGALVDPADREEAERTFTCLSGSKLRVLASAAAAAVRHPLKFAAALRMTAKMSRASDRGLFKHLAYLAEAARLSAVLKRRGVTHVHVHFGTNAAAVARLMKRLAGITYSMTIHGPGEFDAALGFGLAAKVADAAFTVAISHYCKAQLCRWVAPEHWGRIHVVHCTVNPEFLAPSTPVSESADTLVCVGRLTPQKGQLLLLEAFAAAVRNKEHGQLVLAGDGELRPRLEQRIAELGLQKRVRITGWVTESQVRDLLRGSRGLVLPSSAEGLPVVIMEALALGRPVITTHVAAIPELVDHGSNGWLVPAGDRKPLTAAIRKVLAAPAAVLTAAGLNGRRRVAMHHNSVTEGAKLEALFCEYLR